MWNFTAVALAVLCTFAVVDEPAAPDEFIIAPEALIGCRAPDEANCERCCVKTTDDGRCLTQAGAADWELYAVEPWYNATEIVDGACPAECPRCARCSERDEAALRALPSRPECDCDSLTVGIDPCFVPTSCACFCQIRGSLLSRCPLADAAVEEGSCR